MNVSDIDIDPIDDGQYQRAIDRKIARFNRENPDVDPVRLANVIVDRLTPDEACYLLVDVLHERLEDALSEAANALPHDPTATEEEDWPHIPGNDD